MTGTFVPWQGERGVHNCFGTGLAVALSFLCQRMYIRSDSSSEHGTHSFAFESCAWVQIPFLAAVLLKPRDDGAGGLPEEIVLRLQYSGLQCAGASIDLLLVCPVTE